MEKILVCVYKNFWEKVKFKRIKKNNKIKFNTYKELSKIQDFSPSIYEKLCTYQDIDKK